MSLIRTTTAIAVLALTYGASAAELPEAIAAKGETVVLQVHAEGAQIYECRAAQGGGSPPRSEPANNQARRPRAMPRSARSAALLVRQMRPSARNLVKATQRVSI